MQYFNECKKQERFWADSLTSSSSTRRTRTRPPPFTIRGPGQNILVVSSSAATHIPGSKVGLKFVKRKRINFKGEQMKEKMKNLIRLVVDGKCRFAVSGSVNTWRKFHTWTSSWFCCPMHVQVLDATRKGGLSQLPIVCANSSSLWNDFQSSISLTIESQERSHSL